ncbi:MAG: ribokinase [Glaciihabitans sp.]|nr:ribokinase [Glaciihabitans sp.]
MKISVVGGYGVGMTMRLDQWPRVGETVAGGVLSIGPGGKGSNQAIACARLGAEVSLFTAVGSDSAADDARALWEAEGVDSTAVVTKAGATMTGFILVDADGENRITIAPGALDLIRVADLHGFAATIRASDVLIVSLEIPMVVAAAALDIARDGGVSTVLNPAPAAVLPASIWRSVDYLTPNETEAGRLLGGKTGSDDAEGTAAELGSRFRGVVVMTRGGLPTLVDTGGASFAVDALAVDTVEDTTGAGDAFTAALTVALVDGLDLEQAVRFANAAGALAVGVRDVIPSLPRRADIERLLAKHSRKAELT